MDYLIFVDVSADIDIEIAKKYDIRFVPMEYVLGEENFYCKEPESQEMMHEYYEKLRGKIDTHTSQITPNHYYELFEPYIKDGKSIMYISLSSGLSNTYESALLAVDNLRDEYENAKIEVIDSLSATGGMGILCELAAINRENGMSIEENAAIISESACNINHWFTVDDLMYLKRGGRISSATAVIGTALNIKPILRINSIGKLETIEKKRGTRAALKYLLERFEETADTDACKIVYICCSDCMESAEALKTMLLEKYPDLNVRVTMLSPIIGAHTGPDMTALIHYGTKRD